LILLVLQQRFGIEGSLFDLSSSTGDGILQLMFTYFEHDYCAQKELPM